MAVRRDGKGQWRYRKVVIQPDGCRVRIFGTPMVNTKAEAETAERNRILRILNPPPERKEVPTFRKFVEDEWWPVYPDAAGNRFSTKVEKEAHLRLYLMPHLGNVPLDQVRGQVVDGLFAKLKQRNLSPKTCKNVRGTLRKILQTAVDWGKLPAMPPLQKIKAPDPTWDHYTAEEAEQLYKAARTPEELALLLFAVHTGARAGEQLAIEWGDIDFVSHKVVFRRARTRGRVGPTKGGRERRVPLTRTLEAALKAMKHLKGKLVFCNPDGSYMSVYQLHERLWSASRSAGLRKVRWHDLRHSFASQLAVAGVPSPQIPAWMGHQSIQMTMRYAHLASAGASERILVLDAPPWQRRGNGEEALEQVSMKSGS